MVATKKYKIVYWLNGNKKKETIEAKSASEARIAFYLSHAFGDIISIEEVK